MRLFTSLLLLLAACGDKDGVDTTPTDDSATPDDIDGDGFPAAVDCDDEDGAVFPGAPEACNDVDDDCDGAVDEDATDAVTAYADADNDGYGDEATAVAVCAPNADQVLLGGDCDDADPEINPDAEERCDGLDNDCDGVADGPDAPGSSTWYLDYDGDGYGGDWSMDTCDPPEGYIAQGGDCNDRSPEVYPGAVETCDGVDTDCDGDEDDAIDQVIWYYDADGDGHAGSGAPRVACEAPADYYADADDCDDNDAAVSPDAPEVCDGIDNDCDGAADGPDAQGGTVWYLDYDGDGYGATRVTVTACAAPSGYVADATDCDDLVAESYPGAPEVCDGDDNDCDGQVDDNPTDGTRHYADIDGDGYGDPNTGTVTCGAIPSGRVSDATDCDDASGATYPGADEYCDGVDTDCDGTLDENDALDASTWYLDADGDGSGDDNVTMTACSQPNGYVAQGGDCDDSDNSVVDCGCTLTGVGSPVHLVSAGTTQGSWMEDPLETLGAGKVWELDGYTSTSVVEFASRSAMQSRSSTRTRSLPYQSEGTGAQVYDGHLYYVRYNTNTIIKMDLNSGAYVGSLSVPGAGYHNTYPWGWGGYSDIDIAFDEDGMWLIYATSSNSGRIVVSSVDISTFRITQTWNTNSSSRSGLGNAWMMCGVLYTTGSYSNGTTTVNYAYDTADSSTWTPGITFYNPGGYNSSVAYNPRTGELLSWDSRRRQVYTTTSN